MDHLGKVKIYLESGNVVAGDYLKGWIVIKCNHDGHKVFLSTSATETLKVIQNSGLVKEKSATIFDHSEQLTSRTSQIEETFPFILKVPGFCPNSFSFTYDDDEHGRKIEASVVGAYQEAKHQYQFAKLKMIIATQTTNSSIQ